MSISRVVQRCTAVVTIGAAVTGLAISYVPVKGGEEPCHIIVMTDWWWDRPFPVPNEYAHSGGEDPEDDPMYEEGDWDEHTDDPYRVVYESDYHWTVDPKKTYNAHQQCGGPGGSN